MLPSHSVNTNLGSSHWNYVYLDFITNLSQEQLLWTEWGCSLTNVQMLLSGIMGITEELFHFGNGLWESRIHRRHCAFFGMQAAILKAAFIPSSFFAIILMVWIQYMLQTGKIIRHNWAAKFCFSLTDGWIRDTWAATPCSSNMTNMSMSLYICSEVCYFWKAA